MLNKPRDKRFEAIVRAYEFPGVGQRRWVQPWVSNCSTVQGSIEFVEEEGNESIVTSESSEGEVVGELSFFFGMPQSSNSRSKLNNPGAMLYVLYREVRVNGRDTTRIKRSSVFMSGLCPDAEA